MKGWTFNNGTCQKEAVCESGHTLKDGKCQMSVEGPYFGTVLTPCPNNATVGPDGKCHEAQSCPPGFTEMNGTCIEQL